MKDQVYLKLNPKSEVFSTSSEINNYTSTAIPINISNGLIIKDKLQSLNSNDYLSLDYIKQGTNNLYLTTAEYTKLINLPVNYFNGDYNNLTNKPDIPHNLSELNNDVGYITNVDWQDVNNKPSAFTPTNHNHDISDILNFPQFPTNLSSFTNDVGFITTVNWNSITNKPSTFVPAAHSHSYGSLTGLPDIPTTLSQLTNDAGFITSVSWSDITNKPNIPTNTSELVNDSGYITDVIWDEIGSKPVFANVAYSGSYFHLASRPTALSQFTNDSGFITNSALTWNNISGKPTSFTPISHIHNYSDISGTPVLSTVALTGNYADLIARPTVPTLVSQLTNDSNFITLSSVTWDNVSNKPSVFTPSSHSHDLSVLTGSANNANNLNNQPASFYLNVSNMNDGTLNEARIPQGFTTQRYAQKVTLIDGDTINWNLNIGQVAKVVIAGNRILANPTNMQDGATYILIVQQDNTGNRTLTFSSDYIFTNLPILSTAANKRDVFSFICDGSVLLGTLLPGY